MSFGRGSIGRVVAKRARTMEDLKAEIQRLREENNRLRHYEVEYTVLKGRIEAMVAMLLSGKELHRLPWMSGSKIVETRGDSIGERRSSAGVDLALGSVEGLNDPRALGRSQRAEVDVYVPTPVGSVSVELEKIVGGNGID